MKIRSIVWMIAATALTGTAAAQAPDSAAPRQLMFEAADAIHASVAEGRGGPGAMVGINAAEAMLFDLDDDQRENWQFWPTVRVGLALENMSAAQRRLVHQLLTGALSAAGYLKVVHIMQLEQILEMLDEGGVPRSTDHYKLVLFGTPSMTDPWAWRFEGHHVSLSVAVAPDGVTVTPSFFGSNPAEVVGGPMAGFRVHGILEDLARDVVNSLEGDERAVAIIADRPPGDIFSANIRKPREEWDAWRESLQPEGIAVSDLNEVQQHWVGRMLDEIVGNYRPEIALAYRSDIDIEDLSFAWMGSTERGEPHYFRLQGGDFVFEYDNVQNGGNHVHSVWRNKSSDFGADLLDRHYRTSHLR